MANPAHNADGTFNPRAMKWQYPENRAWIGRVWMRRGWITATEFIQLFLWRDE